MCLWSEATKGSCYRPSNRRETIVHLKEAQSIVDSVDRTNRWILDKFSDSGPTHGRTWGSVSSLQRQEGLRLEQLERIFQGEVGDLLFTLVSLSNVMSLDLEQCLTRTMQKYNTRDAKAWINRTHSGDA